MSDSRSSGTSPERVKRIGMWCTMPSSIPAEVFTRSGADFVCIDYQHGLIDHSSGIPILQAISAGPAEAFARVAANQPHLIASALDAGATTIIVPMVNTAQEALRAARSCHYQPRGDRSFGPVRARMVQGTNDPATLDRMQCMVMIETTDGLKNLEAILATPDVDGVFIGPSDLALSLGLKPHPAPYEAKLADAMDYIVRTCKAYGRLVGVAAADGTSGADFFAKGLDFVAISSDLAMLSAAATRTIKEARGELPQESFDRAASTY